MTKRTKQVRKRVGRHSDKVRQACGIEYAIEGSLAAVSKSTNIPETTLGLWKNKGIWDDVIAEVRASNTDRNIAQYDRLTRKALEAAEQAIDKLDLSTLKANDIKSLVISGAASTDKGLLLQGRATSITESTTSMADQIKAFNLISQEYDKRRRIVSEQ